MIKKAAVKATINGISDDLYIYIYPIYIIHIYIYIYTYIYIIYIYIYIYTYTYFYVGLIILTIPISLALHENMFYVSSLYRTYHIILYSLTEVNACSGS